MEMIRPWAWAPLCLLVAAAPAFAQTVTVQLSGTAPYQLGTTVWVTPKLDGVGKYMDLYVNGIKGGNSTVGTINSQNGEYHAPTTMPAGNAVTITAKTIATSTMPSVSGSTQLTLRVAGPTITSISPTSLPCGAAYKLTVSGARYVNGSVVWIHGAAAPTTYVSASKLYATGFASQEGTLSVKVVNPTNGTSEENYSVKVGACGTTPTPTPTPDPTPTPTPTPVPGSVGQAPAPDMAQVAAARFLEQATFGPTAAEIANVKTNGVNAWLNAQFTAPVSPMPVAADLNSLRRNWYVNMATGQDQLRQRMIFALSQIFVVSADKNPYANEMQPWLTTLSNHALGNFNSLLREMTLNPSMGKYLDLGNSIMPSPNENYAREVMQLFTIGPVMLNQDGSVQLDNYGNPIPSYNQATIVDMSRALSGWTYTGASQVYTNWENFTGPLQPRDSYHNKLAKTIVGGINLPAGQTTLQDYDAVMTALFNHPNTPPFIATRLIRAFTTSNPSPAYIKRVADVFAGFTGGTRGDLQATLRAILTDPEARQDVPSTTQGHLKDPMMQSIGLMRAMNATVIDPSNMFWDYFLLGQELLNAPSVFNFYSPMTRLPGSPQNFGPEFQIYAPSLAISRANLMYVLLAGQYNGMVTFDISAYKAVAGNPAALIDLVNANLLQGRMSDTTRQAIGTSLFATSDLTQRALTALYLTAISAEFAVHQ